jgi:hypothetical protein
MSKVDNCGVIAAVENLTLKRRHNFFAAPEHFPYS